MKVVGLIGSKGSGKTYLGVKLAEELKRRGYKVAVIKHTRQEFDFPQKDTTKYLNFCQEVIGISPSLMVKYSKQPLPLENVLTQIQADIVIVEGFTPKYNEKLLASSRFTFPKIICLKAKEEFQSEGLEIAVVRKGEADKKKIKFLCDLIEKLDKFSLQHKVVVSMGEKEIFLNPFISKILEGTLKGFLANLKGAREGDIEIKITTPGK